MYLNFTFEPLDLKKSRKMFSLCRKAVARAEMACVLKLRPSAAFPCPPALVRCFSAAVADASTSGVVAAASASEGAAEGPGRPPSRPRRVTRLFTNVFEPGRTVDIRTPHCVYCADVSFATWEEAQAHQREAHAMVPSLPPVPLRPKMSERVQGAASSAAASASMNGSSKSPEGSTTSDAAAKAAADAAAVAAAIAASVPLDIAAFPVRRRNPRRDCPDCGHDTQRVSQRSDTGRLNRHRTAHGTIPPVFICDHRDAETGRVCGAGFGSRDNYAAHMRTHTGEKRFPCSTCGSSFSKASSLKLHIARKHTGEKSHECSLCASRFTTQWQLNLHLRTHTGAKPYHCSSPGCGASFTTRWTQRRHEVNLHGMVDVSRHLRARSASAARSQKAGAVAAPSGSAAAAAVASVRAAGGASSAAPSAAALAAAAALVSSA